MSNVQDILHFAEFGVVLMLFWWGWNCSPAACGPCAAHLRHRQRAGAGLRRRAVCGRLAGRAALARGLVAALGLALSSTAIALQVLAERNLMRTSSGRAGFQSCCSRTWRPSPSWRCCPAGRGRGAGDDHSAGEVLLEALKIVGVIGAIVARRSPAAAPCCAGLPKQNA